MARTSKYWVYQSIGTRSKALKGFRTKKSAFRHARKLRLKGKKGITVEKF